MKSEKAQAKAQAIVLRTQKSAERMRLTRARRQDGKHLVRVLVGKPEIEALTSWLYLEAEDQSVPNAVRDALERLLQDLTMGRLAFSA